MIKVIINEKSLDNVGKKSRPGSLIYYAIETGYITESNPHVLSMTDNHQTIPTAPSFTFLSLK